MNSYKEKRNERRRKNKLSTKKMSKERNFLSFVRMVEV